MNGKREHTKDPEWKSTVASTWLGRVSFSNTKSQLCINEPPTALQIITYTMVYSASSMGNFEEEKN